MNNLLIDNEFSQLESLIIGSGHEFGGCPNISDTYDPKSKQSIINNTYPPELNIVKELRELTHILEKYNVTILRPDNLPNCNQVFARDVGFVIGDKFFISNMIYDRQDELKGLSKILMNFSSEIINISKDVYIEGGDVVISENHIFIGYSSELDFETYKVSRTNLNAIKFLSNKISNKKIIGFELIKSDDNPYKNCLHLDCCFQPLGLGHVIVCPEAFKNFEDVKLIESIFGKDNVINISMIEMYNMFSNIFSISSNIVISERKFTRLNNILFEKGYKVELVNFSEISKMGGLLRCATLPLIRK